MAYATTALLRQPRSFMESCMFPARNALPGFFSLTALAVLVFASPSLAAEEKDLNGVWTFDAPATLELMREAGDLPASVNEVRARLGQMRVTIDTMGKVFRVTENGKERENNPIVMISEKGGIITLHRQKKSGDQYRLLPDGRLQGLENGIPAFVLKREP